MTPTCIAMQELMGMGVNAIINVSTSSINIINCLEGSACIKLVGVLL